MTTENFDEKYDSIEDEINDVEESLIYIKRYNEVEYEGKKDWYDHKRRLKARLKSLKQLVAK